MLDHAGDGVDVTIEQIQTNTGLFTMPIDIVVETTAGCDTVSVWNDAWSQDFFLTADAEPTNLVFDPDEWILREASYVGSGIFDGAPAGRLALSVASNPSPRWSRRWRMCRASSARC